MLTELQIRKFTKLFTMYDYDNSGSISLADFDKVVKKIAEMRKLSPNSAQINTISNKFAYYWINIKGDMDKNRDYKVSLQEWLDYHAVILNDKKKYESEIVAMVNLIFDVFDTDGDGTINRQEWIDFLSVYNNHRIYAEKSFVQIDLNQDGFLCKEEFLKVLYDFYHSDDPKSLGNYLFIPY